MSLKADRAHKALSKQARRGFRGYPLATIAFYGPDDRIATKAVVGIIAREGAEAEPMRKWFSERDLRREPANLPEIQQFLAENAVASVAMVDRVIGCPHEERIDYLEGESCRQCPYWRGRDRRAGELFAITQPGYSGSVIAIRRLAQAASTAANAMNIVR
jgi:hypothetical protein